MDYLKPISIFEGYYCTTTGLTKPLNRFLHMVYYGDYKEIVLKIRRKRDKSDRDRLKATLPAATISGTFSERKKSGLIEHSGFICLDIDAKDNPNISNWSKARDELATIQNVCFSALSVSGKGVFVVIPIAYPDKHEQHFEALKKDFQQLGYMIDSSCRDVSRLRGLSYDPDAFLNESAVPYERVYKRPKIKVLSSSIHPSTNSLDFLIEKIIVSGIDITKEYEHWVQLGRSLVNEYGDAGREKFHQLSQYYPGYDYDECDRQYDACMNSPGNATGSTIFYLAKLHGIMLKTKTE